MKIEITEQNGIKHAPYGHMLHGEIRVVDAADGEFFCANGWARDVDGNVETGERGSLDRVNPEEWKKDRAAEPREMIEPTPVHMRAK